MENCCLITLIEKFKKQDMSAFPIIFAEFEKLIHYYTARYGSEDAFQELTVFFIELLYRLDTSEFKKDNTDTLKRYIAVSIRNKYISLLREKADSFSVDFSCAEYFYGCDSDFFEKHILKEALSNLSQKQREIIIYKYIHGYSDAEISEHLKTSR